MRAAAVLFDLDGTLVSTAGAGKRSLERAVAEATGVVGGVARLRLDGMTDRAIVREAVLWGRTGAPACTEAEIDAALERYLTHLEAAIPSPSYAVMPHVHTQIERLRAAGIAVGLGTGNVERGARIKLQPAGLNPLLPFGGFGDDAEDRAELLRAGHRRASHAVGRELRGEEVWVVGDTPKDIAAARKAGLRVLGVATGGFSVNELRACGPDAALVDLAEAWAVLAKG